MHATCIVTFIEQKRIIYKFLNNVNWVDMKNTYIKNRNYKLNNNNIEDILHMVIIPIFKEDPLVIDNTLNSLAKQNVSMIIGLALEEREMHSDIKYNNIVSKYENKFLKIIKTIHPDGLKNEVAGKASNCNYCVQILVKYYENSLKDSYDYVMITACDCDSIWCQDYFLYLNYLSVKNNLKYFNHIIYTPNITNVKHFQPNHILTNWMSITRSIATHGHFRCLGSIRTFTSEYHIPLILLKKIDYWDNDLVHEDVHMCNKLAILNEKCLIFKSTFLPCDNQTPTNIRSVYQSFILLWCQSLRWNFFIYDLYYLFHQLLLNLFNIKRYENFQINSWKVFMQIINNYENLFYFFVAPIFNNIFWILYLCLFNNYYNNNLIYYLLNYIQPYFIIIHMFLTYLCTLLILNANDEDTKGELYRGKKYCLFILGVFVIPFFSFIYQCINLVIAWIQTLKSSYSHADSAFKITPNTKQK
ncbi:unnamed protein product [Rotaria sp. Silwood2]|nr:unnamed protein product [Rotaria sp. Silwood2]CAF4184291.1 unnamed protein product [Rotaria sp. Silwood2]CAF4385560.1 unnamed protein product [Rotaria sp. Silwood2]CAF4400987.1 unnamed protein product [Rotaria sp. Silwood2]